jgi:hypothetical protein
MPSLTNEVRNAKSPVARWLRSTFPNHRGVQAGYREGAGPCLVLPEPAVSMGTQGAAIDWWLRMLVDPGPSIGLAILGLRSLRARRMPCSPAAHELLGSLLTPEPQRPKNPAISPARFADRPDEWWARLCYALALLVEAYRAVMIDGSRLTWLTANSRADDLLSLANDDEVNDLIAMRDLARLRLLPALPAGPIFTGSTFDGSADIAADADLIAGGLLVDFKAGQGGTRRADGTRAATMNRPDLDQLLGYVLLDYSDAFTLHTVAIYHARFGYFASWPIRDLATELAGHPVDLPELRQQFAQFLRALRQGSSSSTVTVVGSPASSASARRTARLTGST